MKSILALAMLILLIPGLAGASSDELGDLLDRVAAMNISRNGYVLGKALIGVQKNRALSYPVEIDNRDLFKFRDGNLYLVAQKKGDRIIIMYEEYDEVPREKIQEVVGDLFLDYGKPTVFSHDKVIYWAWGQDGVISNEAFKAAKKKQQPVNVLATVKLNSSLEIMEPKDDKKTGSVYYIISSDPALKLIQLR